MEQNGNTVIPLRSSLPEQCYVFVQTEKDVYKRQERTSQVERGHYPQFHEYPEEVYRYRDQERR